MKTSIEKISTMEDLVDALKNKPEEIGYLDIMKSIDIPREEFERYYTWSDDHYTRNCLIKTDDYELILICWEKGQTSPIHDYSSKEAWIHIIHGQLTEECFYETPNGLQQVSSVHLGPSDFSYMTDPISIHRYTNYNDARTVSLNLYAKPVKKWWEYDPETGATTEKDVSCDMEYHLDKEGIF